MDAAADARVADLERRLSALLRIGRIAAVEAGPPPRAVVDLAAEGEDPLPVGPFPVLVPRAGSARDWTPPAVGERAALWSPGGEDVLCLVGPSLSSAAFPVEGGASSLRTWHDADGAEWARAEADPGAGTLEAAVGADVSAVLSDDRVSLAVGDASIVVEGTSITLSAGGRTATLDASGLASDGDVSDSTGSMASMRGTYNGHVHPTSSGPTGATAQKMT